MGRSRTERAIRIRSRAWFGSSDPGCSRGPKPASLEPRSGEVLGEFAEAEGGAAQVFHAFRGSPRWVCWMCRATTRRGASDSRLCCTCGVATPLQQPHTEEELTEERDVGDHEDRVLGEHRDEAVEGVAGAGEDEQG